MSFNKARVGKKKVTALNKIKKNTPVNIPAARLGASCFLRGMFACVVCVCVCLGDFRGTLLVSSPLVRG